MEQSASSVSQGNNRESYGCQRQVDMSNVVMAEKKKSRQDWERQVSFDVPSSLRDLWIVFVKEKVGGKAKEHGAAALMEYMGLDDDARQAVFYKQIVKERPKHVRKSKRAIEGLALGQS